MASSTSRSGSRDDGVAHNGAIAASERGGREHEQDQEGAKRSLFDLRTIIGGLFCLYGLYLTVRGITDGNAAIQHAAGVRINLWTGLGALVVGAAFVAWAMLRPLTIQDIEEAQEEDDDQERAREELEREREAAVRQH